MRKRQNILPVGCSVVIALFIQHPFLSPLVTLTCLSEISWADLCASVLESLFHWPICPSITNTNLCHYYIFVILTVCRVNPPTLKSIYLFSKFFTISKLIFKPLCQYLSKRTYWGFDKNLWRISILATLMSAVCEHGIHVLYRFSNSLSDVIELSLWRL